MPGDKDGALGNEIFRSLAGDGRPQESRTSKQPVTAMDDDLCMLSANEILGLFRQRKLSPVEFLESTITRIEKTERLINAFSSLALERARKEARIAEKLYSAGKGKAPGKLEGLPVALKNEHTRIGDNTDQGSILLKEVVDTNNMPITQRLLDAGAITHGKTNVPEFLCAMFTCTRLHGVTRNPWNREVTCGGSSGGSAAALAVGSATLATGSDIGGSIRIPAAFCGVVGLKPSYGRVPESEMLYAMNPYSHIGPLARTVADCALLFDVLNGPHPADPFTVKPPLTVNLEFPDIRGLRIGLSEDLDIYDVDDEIRKSVLEAGEVLKEAGASVKNISVKWDPKVKQAGINNLSAMMGRLLHRMIEGREDSVSDYVIEFANAGMEITIERFMESIDMTANLYLSLREIFGEFDAIICPTLASVDVPAEGLTPQLPFLAESAMTLPFNMTSRHPVLAVPSGFASNDVPTGVQIVGRPYEDNEVLRIGAAMERISSSPRWVMP